MAFTKLKNQISSLATPFLSNVVSNLAAPKSAANAGKVAASLKQIEAVDQNVEEGVRVLIDGAINSRRAAEENNMKAACFISSDKSRAATTLYGSMKFIAGESFIVNAERSNVKLSCAIYGNVLNSTGSIIPLIWDSINRNYPLTLYSNKMTRFMIDIEDAMNLIEKGLNVSGYNVIPNLKSFLVKDLLYYHKSIPIGTVISGTESANAFYSNHIPSIFIHDAYTPEIINNALLRQKMVIKQIK